MIQAWQEGTIPFSEPLKLVEELIDQEILEPDVLYDDGTKCKYAEVFIHADVGEIGGDLAAYVINSLSGEELILDPTTTAGVHL